MVQTQSKPFKQFYKKKRMVNYKLLTWNVFHYNFNLKKIEKMNIFYGGFLKDVENILVEDMNRKDFDERLNTSLLYYYWSKCEHEIVIKPWVGDDSVEYKTDIYTQVILNWKQFSDYVWSFKR